MKTIRAALAPLVLALLVPAVPLRAQSPPASSSEPPLRRWFEIQSFTIYSRYRFTSNSKDVTTADQLQYKDQLQARVNLDAAKRYTVNVGYFTGSSFISTWDNWGVGNSTAFDGKNNYVKQLYVSAIPVKGLEVQYGGLYLNRGDADEWVTYDTDGYVAGERVSLRRPKALYLDEITVTRAAIGPYNTPNLLSRWDGLKNPNYTQVLGRKLFSKLVGGSFEYNRQIGADYLRAAITLRLPKASPVSTIRWEQYRRLNLHPASGIGLWAARPVTKYAQVQAGYVSVDRFYGGWNADRMASGRRLFISANIKIYGPLTASLYATRAFSVPYSVSIDRRFDAVIQYSVLDLLRRSGVF